MERTIPDDVKGLIINWARDEGERVVADGKTIWGGLGNRSGLHDFAYELIKEKWEKSGERFTKKINKLRPSTIELKRFNNTSRDRGKWQTIRTFEINTMCIICEGESDDLDEDGICKGCLADAKYERP